MKQLGTVEWSVVCLSTDGREETQYSPFRGWVNTRTPESNPLKYLKSKNKHNFLSMVGIEAGTFCLANKLGLTMSLSHEVISDFLVLFMIYLNLTVRITYLYF
jgi:hypothetical protein